MTFLTQFRAPIQILILVILTVSSCSAQGMDNPYDQRLLELHAKFDRSSMAGKAVLLDQMSKLRDYVNDYASVTRTITRIADQDKSALVRDEAKWHLAQIAVHERRLPEAKSSADSLGFIRDWRLVGKGPCTPNKLSTRGSALHSTPIAVVKLHDQPGTVCVATAVYSVNTSKVALRFGANTSATLSVNAANIASGKSDSFAFDQHSAGVQLEAGWNTIAIQLTGLQPAKEFALRITTPQGGGLNLTKDSMRMSAKVAPAKIVAVDDLLTLARQQPALHGSAASLGTLAALEKLRGVGKYFDHFQSAAQLELTPERWLDVARACIDRNCTLASLNKALAAGPKNVNVKAALADYFLHDGQLDRSLQFLRELVSQNPADFVARHKLYEAYTRAGEDAAADAELSKLEAYDSHPLFLRRELGLAYEQAGLAGKAAASLTRVWSLSFDDSRVRSALQRLAMRRGDTFALAMLAQARAALDPSDPVAHRETAQYALSPAPQGTVPETAAPVTAEQNSADQNSHVGREISSNIQLESAASRTISATARDTGVRLPSPLVSKQDFADSEEDYLVSAGMLAADAQENAPGENSNVVVLADVAVERVRDNGQSTLHVQQVFYISNDRGARDYSVRTVQYGSATQKLSMLRARLYKANGSVVDAEDQGETSVDDPNISMYYDTRSRVLRFPGLEKGDVMELQYVLSPNSKVNPYGNYFGTLVAFQTGLPQRLRRYVLIAPSSRKLNIVEERMPARANISRFGANTVYRWDLFHVAPLWNEPRGPAMTEFAPYVTISTIQDWDEFGRWYANLIAPQLKLNAELGDELPRIIKNADTEQQKINAIYEFVLRNTHYVAMEFGVYSYKPYAVSDVYARRFGDCKDKASLMIALLRAAGIDAELALVRTRKMGDVNERSATLSVFNHAIVYIPKYDLWLDGTAEYAGSSELPLDNQGAQALTVNLNGSATLRRIPVTAATQNYTRRTVNAKIQADGNIVFTGSTYTRGEDAPGLRREFELPARQKDTVRAKLARVYQKIQVDSVHVQGANNLERDVDVNFSGSLDSFAGKSTLSLLPSWQPHNYVSSLAGLKSRLQELQLSAPWTSVEELRFAIPENARLEEIPSNVQFDTQFGTAEIRYERKGAELVISTSVQFRKIRIQPSQYSEFREFCSRVEKAFNQPIKVRLAG